MSRGPLGTRPQMDQQWAKCRQTAVSEALKRAIGQLWSIFAPVAAQLRLAVKPSRRTTPALRMPRTGGRGPYDAAYARDRRFAKTARGRRQGDRHRSLHS